MNTLSKILSLIAIIAVFTIIYNPASAQIHVDSSNDVGIGTTSTASSKLRVYNTTNAYALRVQNHYNTTSTKYGIYNYINSTGTGARQGLRNYIVSSTSSTASNYGTYNRLNAYGTGRGYGIYNYVYPNSTATGNKYGVYSYIRNLGTGTRYGIYSSINGASGYAGYFVGNVYVAGTVTSTSDARTKKDVKDVENALALVNQLAGKTYNFKDDAEKGLPSGKQYGFIAQELEQVIPELVEDVLAPGTPIDEELTEEQIANGEVHKDKTTPDTTFKSVNYIGMIPILVEAIKEQQELIEQQQVTLERQQTEIDALKAAIRK